jgi:hypothetical protein
VSQPTLTSDQLLHPAHWSLLSDAASRQVRYLGEREISGKTLVVWAGTGPARDQSEVQGLLDPRLDLAPGLPPQFDWGPAAVRPRAVRLALAMLADALNGLYTAAETDELALRYCQLFAVEAVGQFPDAWFDHGAWATRRWVAGLQDEGRAG